MLRLYTLSPLHFSLIEPLVRWRILSLEHILSLNPVMEKSSSFYKKIKQLEVEGFIEGSIEPYSGKKYIYLTRKGLEHFGRSMTQIVNGNNIHHDSLVSDLLFEFRRYSFCQKVVTEVEVMEEQPLIKYRPDGYFAGVHKGEFRMALEIELTMKASDRVKEIFSFYHQSPFFNNVLYIFASPEVYQFYRRVLKKCEAEFDVSKFLFLYLPTLHRREFDLLRAEVFLKGEITTLEKLFGLQAQKIHWAENGGGMPSSGFLREEVSQQN